jgi:tRNA (cmo5U34)-methyltransferase
MPVPASFDRFARVTLPGYDDLHDIAGCLLAESLPTKAKILTVGVGTGQELVVMGRHGKKWRFVAVDPSEDMVAKTQGRIGVEGLSDRVTLVHGTIEDVDKERAFDAATLMLVLHLIEGREAQLALLQSISSRLRKGAPLVLAVPCSRLRKKDLFVRAWRRRWLTQGMLPSEIDRRFEDLQQTMQPLTEDDVIDHLEESGFVGPRKFFRSLFFNAWIARRR